MEIIGSLHADHSQEPEDVQEFFAWYDAASPSVRRTLEKSLAHTTRIYPTDGPQADAYFSLSRILAYGGAAGGGKDISSSTYIKTPRGNVAHGDIESGDLVCSVDGGLAKVLTVTRYDKNACHRISFSDGTSIDAGEGHLWLVWRSHIGTKVRTSAKADTCGRVYGPNAARLLRTCDLIREMDRGREYRIPLCEPAVGNFNRYKFDPYALGVLLGDGSMPGGRGRGCTISLHREDREILESLVSALDGFWIRSESSDPSMITGYLSKQSTDYPRLRAMGMLGKRAWEKNLPKSVFYAPIEWRWSLLQGLMDTDGWCEPLRCAYYCTTSPMLRDGVADLARSLGCFVTVTDKFPTYTSHEEKVAGRPAWTVRIKSATPEKLFRLERKKRIAADLDHQSLSKEITDITPIGKLDTTCIQVDHPSGLYLTNDYTVTHNSALIAILALTAHLRTGVFRSDGSQLLSLIDDVVDFAGTSEGLNRNTGIHRLVAGYNDDGRPIPRIIEYCGIGKPEEWKKYRGRPHDLKAYDECTELVKDRIMVLQAWNRSAVPGQRVRALMCFNPPQDSKSKWLIDFFADWVDDRHPNPAMPGELRWFYRNSEGEEVRASNGDPVTIRLNQKDHVINPISRTFIPATYSDNPYLTDEYRDTLFSLEGEDREAFALGIFKRELHDDERQVIPTLWVEEAMDRWTPEGKQEIMDAMGIDVARGGKCQTCLSRRHGWWWDELILYPGKECIDGYVTAGYCAKHRRDNADMCIDANAVGASPADILGKSYPTFPVLGQAKENMPKVDKLKKMYNWRTCLWWVFRNILDPKNRLFPVLPNDRALRAELTAPIYFETSNTIQVEQKDQVVERIGYSPDRADAVITSIANIFLRGAPHAERICHRMATQAQADKFLKKQRLQHELVGASGGRGGWQGT